MPPLRILVVEDDDINQIVARRLLERRGHCVMTVGSGPDALALLMAEHFHCVFMDLEMPGLTGPETLSRLRDSSIFGESATTPVIALTAHADEGYRERMLAHGFDGYLSKPIDVRELDDALLQVIAHDARDADDSCGSA